MSAAPAIAATLSRADVLATVERLRRQLDDVLAELVRLYDGRAWVALGFPSWQAFTAAELPQLEQLGAVDKRAAVIELRRHGASLRAAAQPFGLSAATAKAYVDEAGVKLATVTSLDGRARPATSTSTRTARPRIRRTDRVVELVAAAGPQGLSVVDVAERTRWQRHVVSATLTRLTQSGRLTYDPPARRGLFGRYVGRINP